MITGFRNVVTGVRRLLLRPCHSIMTIKTGDTRWARTEHRVYRVTVQKGELRGDLRFTFPERPFHVANTSCFLLLLVSLVVVVTVVAFLAFAVIRGSSKFRRWVILLQFLTSISMNLWNTEVDCSSANQSSFVEAFCSICDVGFACYDWIPFCLKQGSSVFFSFSFILFPTSFWL